MTIKCIQKYNRHEPGDVLHDVFQQDAQRLIAEGFFEEVQPEPAPVFKKHDWKAEHEKEAAEKAAREAAEKTGGFTSPNTADGGEGQTTGKKKSKQ